MARTIQCIKLGKEAEGLDFPPYPGELGKRIYENVSKEAWAAWLKPHAGKLVPAPKGYGDRRHKAIEPAPGRYVKAKA